MSAADFIAAYGCGAVFFGALVEGEAVLIVAVMLARQGCLELSAVLAAAVLGAAGGRARRPGRLVGAAPVPQDRPPKSPDAPAAFFSGSLFRNPSPGLKAPAAPSAQSLIPSPVSCMKRELLADSPMGFRRLRTPPTPSGSIHR